MFSKWTHGCASSTLSITCIQIKHLPFEKKEKKHQNIGILKIKPPVNTSRYAAATVSVLSLFSWMVEKGTIEGLLFSHIGVVSEVTFVIKEPLLPVQNKCNNL